MDIVKIKKIYSLLSKKIKKRITLLYIVTFLSAISEIITIGAILPLIDILVTKNNEYKIINDSYLLLSEYISVNMSFEGYVITIFIILISLASLVKMIQIKQQGRVVHDVGHEIALVCYKNYTEMNYEERYKINLSTFTTIIQQRTIDLVRDLLIPAVHIPIAIIYLTIVLGILIYLNPIIMLLFSLISTVFYGILIKTFKRKINIYGKLVNKNITIENKNLTNFYRSNKENILNNEDEMYLSEFKKVDKEIRRAKGSIQILSAVTRPLIELLLMSSVMLFMYVKISNNTIIDFIPMLAMFVLGASKIIPIMQKAYNGYTLMKGSEATLIEIIEFYEKTKKLKNKNKNNYQYISNFESIKIENLSYSINQENILQNINFQMKVGAAYKISGPSGSGKSTLLNIISGLLKPKYGKIRYLNSANDDINELPKIFYCGQNTVILESTLKEYITKDMPIEDAKYKKIKNICKISDLNDNKKINDSSTSISGGQKQRIQLAKGLYQNPNILILDEALTGVDEKSEINIFDNILNSMNDKMVIILVTHQNNIKVDKNKELKLGN